MHKLRKVIGAAAMLAGVALSAGCGGGSGQKLEELPRAVAVQAEGADSAFGFKTTYGIAYGESGDYTYSISNFDSGDRLLFPAGNAISVDNESFTDGKLKLSCTSDSGARVTVLLTGLSPQGDKAVSVDDLNLLFGAGSVAQQ